MPYRAISLVRGVLQKEVVSYNFKKQIFQQMMTMSTRSISVMKISPDATEFKTEGKLVYPSDPDTFGTLSGKWVNKRTTVDEGDLKEDEFLQNVPLKSQKLTTRQYADLIKQYVKNKLLKEAINVLEVKMLKEDRVKPENYIYSLLIDACAELGYTKKAFKLYNDVKRRGLKVTGDMYTSLFVACANSPWPDDGLRNAMHLRELMKEKGIEPNVTNYNSMIKAFGRCGDLSTAFQIVDEMISKKIKIRIHTFNFLLQACISDKENGLRHAVVVWRKILLRREKPNIYSFNLMLKCVKDCHFGAKEDIAEVLSMLSQSTNKLVLKQKEQLRLESNETVINSTFHIDNEVMHSYTNEGTVQKEDVHIIDNMQSKMNECKILKRNPNLLSKNLQIEEVVSLQEVITPADKFSFIGGITGFLREMKEYNVKPDIKTMTQLLAVIPDNKNAEEELMYLMKALEIRGDIDFYNTLIRKRCFRKHYDDALSVRNVIEEENKVRKKKHPMKKHIQLKLNLLTYGALALTCTTKQEAEALLTQMREGRLKINIEILGTLLRQATCHFDFGYVIFILKTAQEESLKINYTFKSHLENFHKSCEDMREKDENGKRKGTDRFLKAHGIYTLTYKTWLEEMKQAGAFETQHMWAQFNNTQPETVQRQNLIKPPRKFIKPKWKRIPAYKA